MFEEASPDHATARAALAAGVLAGIAYAVVTVLYDPAQVGIASDVYYHAGRAVLTGGDVYAVAPPNHPGYRYLYPPVVAPAFVPHALLGSELAALALQTVLNVAAGLGTAALLWRMLARRGVDLERVDAALLAAFSLLSVHAVPLVLMGQVTLPLALAVAAGLDALDRERPRLAGAAFAAAALVKLFPAAMGAWLVRRRAWWGVGAALAVGIGGLLLGAALLGPATTVTYLGTVLPGQFQGSAFAGGPSPAVNFVTVRRQLAALLPVPASWLTPLAAAVLAPPVAALYRRVDTDPRRQAAVLGTLVATLLFLPLEPLYFPILWVPLVVLLYDLPAGRARRVLAAGTLGTYLLVDLGTVLLAAALLPAGAGEAVVAAARAVFTVIQPPAVGLWLLLAGCLLVASAD